MDIVVDHSFLIPSFFSSIIPVKAQIVLLAILVIAQVDFVIGSIIGPTDDSEKAKGFMGYSGKFSNRKNFGVYLYST